MNKEALRKELDDALNYGWDSRIRGRFKRDLKKYVDDRLAALDDDKELTKICMAASEKSLAKDWVDDGQEGKATMKELVRKIFGDEAAEDKDIVDFYQQVHQTAIEERRERKALERISKYEVDDGKLSRDMLYEVIDIATKALGQPTE